MLSSLSRQSRNLARRRDSVGGERVRPGAAGGQLEDADAGHRLAAGRIQAVPANLILVKNISVIGVVCAEIKQTMWKHPVAARPAAISIRLDVLSEFSEPGNSVCEDLFNP
jgi:hypothetical protein